MFCAPTNYRTLMKRLIPPSNSQKPWQPPTNKCHPHTKPQITMPCSLQKRTHPTPAPTKPEGNGFEVMERANPGFSHYFVGMSNSLHISFWEHRWWWWCIMPTMCRYVFIQCNNMKTKPIRTLQLKSCPFTEMKGADCCLP